MKKILWIGSFITGEALVEARKRGYGNPASVQSQKNLVEGLEEAYGLKFDTIGALVLHAYPFVKTKVFKEIDFSHISGAQDCVVKFYNFTYINKVSSQINLCKKVEKWAKGHKNDDVEVFVYEMRSACINAAISLKRIIPSAKIHLIIPDIPAFMDLRMGRIKRIMKKIDYFNMKSNFSRIDDFIVYSETMIDYLDIRNRNWVVMEGSMGFRKFQNLVLKRFRINNEFDIAVAYSNDICKDGIPISGGSNYCVKYCVNAKKKIAWIHNEVQHQGFTPEYCKENFKLYDCIINVSEGCKRLFDAMAPEYIDKSHVIYNIIDYSRIERLARESKPVEIDNNMFTIVTAARLEEGQKRISRIISCCRKLKEEGYDGFRWLVLGDGPNSTEYSQSIKEYGLEDVLCFLGRKNNPYVYMKNADVFILPSLYESFGLVLKEAMAVGCPVISTDFEAAKEIIHDNYDGFICDNSEEGIFNITKHILDDKSVLEKIRTNLRESDNNLNAVAVNQFQTIVG